MKIGLVAQSCDRRTGIGRIVNSLAREFLGTGHTVVCAAQNFEDADRRMRTYRVPSFPLSQGLSKLFFRLDSLVIPKSEVDIVHTFGVGRRADVVSAQSCHRAGLSLLYRHRDTLLESRGAGIFDHVSLADERALLTSSFTKKIIAVSRLVERQIQEVYGIDARKISVVPNGVNHALFEKLRVSIDKSTLRLSLGVPPDAFALLFVGNEFGRKGLSVLMRAVSALGDERLRLIVVGGGERNAYARLASDLHVAEKVHFVGMVTDPESLYFAADAFVFPTLYEPFGLAVIEAMAAGIPVITSKMCGATEGMRDQKEVYLLEDPSSVDEVVSAITMLQKSESLRQSMSVAGLKKVGEFAWNTVADKILAVYEGAATP